jgi:hypothetical protein
MKPRPRIVLRINISPGIKASLFRNDTDNDVERDDSLKRWARIMWDLMGIRWKNDDS